MPLRLLLVLATAVSMLVLAAPALAIEVHVRIEGVRTTLFGSTEPLLSPFLGTLTAEAPANGAAPTVVLGKPTALGALEAASRRGEIYYRLTMTSFGPFVDRIGRNASRGASGWVFKVNGVQPPVGAADALLKDGDRVLWYYTRFGEKGGSPTLELTGASHGCFQAVLRDDAGKETKAGGVVYLVDGRRVRASGGQYCPTGRVREIRATKQGAIPSEVIVLDRAGP